MTIQQKSDILQLLCEIEANASALRLSIKQDPMDFINKEGADELKRELEEVMNTLASLYLQVWCK